MGKSNGSSSQNTQTHFQLSQTIIMSHIETGKSSKTSKASARVKHAAHTCMPHIHVHKTTCMKTPVKKLNRHGLPYTYPQVSTPTTVFSDSQKTTPEHLRQMTRMRPQVCREALRFLKKENPLYVTDSDTDYYSDIPELVPFDHVEVQKRGTLHHHAFWPSGTSSSSDDESSGSESDLPDLVHVVAV